jgi:ketosteroid isomerase-like protein
MAGAAEVVERYQRAFGSGDVQTARSLLADDLHFVGPIEEFENADDYMSSVGKLAQIVTGTDVKKVFADGNDVATICDLHTNTPAGTSNVAEWATVKGGKIVEMRVFFDARPSPPCSSGAELV